MAGGGLSFIGVSSGSYELLSVAGKVILIDVTLIPPHPTTATENGIFSVAALREFFPSRRRSLPCNTVTLCRCISRFV